MRLIDADPFGVVSFQGKSEDFIEGAKFILEKIDEAPTITIPTSELDTREMTDREKAIKILRMNEQERWLSGITVEEEKEAVEMAIEALEEQRPQYGPCANCQEFDCAGCAFVVGKKEGNKE